MRYKNRKNDLVTIGPDLGLLQTLSAMLGDALNRTHGRGIVGLYFLVATEHRSGVQCFDCWSFHPNLGANHLPCMLHDAAVDLLHCRPLADYGSTGPLDAEATFKETCCGK